MKIALFSKHLPSDEPNGVSIQVHRLAEALCALGHEVTVYTLSKAVQGASYCCVTLPAASKSPVMKKFAPALAFRRADKSSFDILHYHGDDWLCRGSWRRVRTFYGSALMEALHATTLSRFCYQALFYLFEWVSCFREGALVAISGNTRLALPVVKTFIPCCVPTERFFPSGEKSRNPSIIFIGDLASRKRGALLLDHFTRTVLPVHPDCTLTVVGPAPCSGRNVIYAGRMDEKSLIDALRASWLLCMPSSYEGFGVPIIEAMACGTTVVATRNPGSESLVRHRENGWLCAPNELGAVMTGLILDTETRKTLAASALQNIRRYDPDLIARQYESLYKSLMRKNETAAS